MIRFGRSCALVLLLTASGLTCAWADDKGEGLGEKLATWQLVRVADLAADKLGPVFAAPGTDPLERGRVDVRRKRLVEVRVEGAAVSTTYTVYFCRPLPACEAIGTLETDSRGDGFAVLPFKLAGETWAGIFTLFRAGANQFVTGFHFPAEEVTSTGLEMSLKGPISAINTGNNSFRLDGLAMDIFVGPGTEFEKIEGFAALKVGQVVEVDAYTRQDGTVMAASIEPAGDEDGPGHGQGHDKDSKHD